MLLLPLLWAVSTTSSDVDEDVVSFAPCGEDGICITVMAAGSANNTVPKHYPTGFLKTPIPRRKQDKSLTQGNLRASLNSNGLLTFQRVSDGKTLLQEKLKRTFTKTNLSVGESIQNGEIYYGVDVSFSAYADEHIYGLGQHKTGVLDNKGQTFQLQPENTEILIPVIHSTRDYSLVWNL